MPAVSTPNPLLKIHLNGFEKWGISQLLGSQWQTKLWNSFVSSFETWASTQSAVDAASIQAFITSHVDGFITSLDGDNVFITLLVEKAVNSLISSLTAGLLAYVTNEAGSLVGSEVPAAVAPDVEVEHVAV